MRDYALLKLGTASKLSRSGMVKGWQLCDIWYSVFIYNVTDENNPTAILCIDCINITETHYTFTPDYLSPCHVYNFSVIPVNGAGQGESSPNVTGYIAYYGMILIVYTLTQIDTVGYYVVPELKICRKVNMN